MSRFQAGESHVVASVAASTVGYLLDMNTQTNFPWPIATGLSFFQRGHLPQEGVEELFQLDDDETNFSRIHCPLCEWQPSASSLWYCGDWGDPEYFFDGCGMQWNTFETRGLCPGCAHQWRWTSCLRCEGWSLHEDWYVEDVNV
jgi:hypothetical protein